MEELERACDAILSTIDKSITNESRLAIIGLGNPYRADDAAGLHVVQRIKGKINAEIDLFEAPDAPENHIFEIQEKNPSHLIVIDAADIRKPPGFVRLIRPEEIPQFTISSHANSKQILFNFLKVQLPNLKIDIIGIQAEKISYEEGLSIVVEKTVALLADRIIHFFSKTC